MKRLYYALIAVIISLLTIHCQREVFDYTGVGANDKAPINATVQGNVIDENGQPAGGVAVKVGTKTVLTDSKGFFRLPKAGLDKKTSLVTAEKNGYFTAYRVFSATNGANHVVLQLIPKTLIGTIPATGGEVSLSNGTKVTLPANAVVNKATGAGYGGTINVYAAYIDPTSAGIGRRVPGSFLAENSNDERVVLTSFGMVAVELESTSAEKLQLATGVKATLTVPVPSSIQSAAPATIPLWFVDEQTGLWQEEGQATKNGNNYVGQVSHFSFWNCDVSQTAVILSMTLKSHEGSPLVHVPVRLTTASGNQSYGWTDSIGQVSGYVPGNVAILLEVLDPCDNAAYSQTVGPLTAATNLGVITVNSVGTSIVTIKGKLINCSGTAVTNGYAIVSIGNQSSYVSSNSSGDFSIAVTRCSTSPSTVDVTGVDNTATQQGTVSATITAPVTNVGNVAACGVSSLEFINYTLDGTNYTLSSTVTGDSVEVFNQSGFYTISGYNQAQSRRVTFGFNVPTPGAGTYPLNWVSAQNASSATLIAPSNVNITNFPTVSGGFYEGNMSSQFKDSLNLLITHNVNATFRVRKN
jgi:hypothetical protein